MSRVYDNWERLVEAVLKREDFKRIALCESFSSCNISSHCSSDSSDEEVSDFQDRVTPYLGAGVAGILHKWVNYGKGWRRRWFVLQDGVFCYYKIHGDSSSSPRSRKPVGEVHLKVSSVMESQSDDKRFYILTGTKRLHLRAESREDRMAWMEALQAAKDMLCPTVTAE